MAVAYHRTVNTTPVVLADMTTLPGGPGVLILNTDSSSTLYIGGALNNANTHDTVLASTTGLAVGPGLSLSCELTGDESLLGVATTTVTVHIFRTGGN